ncbi:MAG TPA: ferredoxin-thioredoxin reductase catalytic domain-containing protein [Verrucomicrobiota bacterium]|nr:ferredoxin-thioredoxin reductase catalytic domain-containing protein [Verrucomicrobiota bacterium]
MNAASDSGFARRETIDRRNDLHLDPDASRVCRVAGLMTDNCVAVGESTCPCEQEHKAAQQGADKACPCPEWLTKIARAGHCLCRLFFTPEESRA